MSSELERRLRAHGVPVLWPGDYVNPHARLAPGDRYDFRTSPCIDFGKLEARTPRFVVRPRHADDLAASLTIIRDAAIPVKVRGSGHSSGGQVLTDDGAVIDISGLSGVVADDPDADTVSILGGTLWLDVCEHLVPQGRRPLVLTDNWRTTVSGTLAVGGFGDTSHRYGLQIASVRRLVVYTVDGERHAVGPGDALFDYSLAGCGQVGVIAEATVTTMRRPHRLAARFIEWLTIDDFLADTAVAGQWEYLRPRVFWERGAPVTALAGAFGDEDDAPMTIDLHELGRRDRGEGWAPCSPALELLLPLPSGLSTWHAMHREVVASGLHTFLPRGASIAVLASDSRFPLAPFPESSSAALLVALRPELPFHEVAHFLPILRRMGRQALDAGGRIYLMSIPVGGERFAERQLGRALEPLRRLRAEVDPANLLNRGVIS